MINIAHTRNKLTQLGIPCRLKGNAAEQRRVLGDICRRNHIAPVLDEEVD